MFKDYNGLTLIFLILHLEMIWICLLIYASSIGAGTYTTYAISLRIFYSSIAQKAVL